MNRSLKAAHNRWCASLSSGRVEALLRETERRVAGILPDPGHLFFEARGVESISRDGFMKTPADERFVLEADGGETGYAVVSPMLSGLIIKKTTGSDRLALYPAFRHAAATILLAELVGFVGAVAGRRFRVKNDVRAVSEGSCERLELSFVTDIGVRADAIFLIPEKIEPPVAEGETSSRAVKCSIAIDASLVPATDVIAMTPGDLLNITGLGRDAGLVFSARTSTTRRIESAVSSQGQETGKYLITGETREVHMQKVTEQDTGPLKAGGVPIGACMLPVRIEVCSFDMPMGKVAALSHGSVVDTGDGIGKEAVMYVCGAPFATGRMEQHEDFKGFRVEKVF